MCPIHADLSAAEESIATAEKTGQRPESTQPFTIAVARSEEELVPYVDSWDDLARNSVEPNVFHESWMLLPALKAYRNGDVVVVLIFSNLAPRRHGKPLLCGLIPLERCRRGPVRVLRLWQYIHCYLGTPLIRAGFGEGVLQVFFEWLARDSRGAPLLELGRITGDGRFQHLLLEYLVPHQCGYLVVDRSVRTSILAARWRLSDSASFQ